VVNNSEKSDEPEVVKKELSIAEKLDNLWKKSCEAFDAYVVTLDDLRRMENAIFTGEDYMCATKVIDDHKLNKLKSELTSSVRGRLVNHAATEFAPIGGKLSIDQSEIREMFEYDEDHPENFSLKAVWEYLEKTYGGQAGEDAAWRQTAAVLVYEFRLKHKKEVIRKAGRTILELSVYLDSFDKQGYRDSKGNKCGSKNRLHYNSSQSVQNVLNELKSYSVWQQNMALAADLSKLVHHFWQNNRDEIESRKQYPCGDDQELILVTYHNKFEFRFSDKCAAQLQLFLGTYGNLNEE
jgi:hypothetical protein